MIDPNTAMSAAGEGAKAVSKFEEILQKIYGPKWTRKQADADAYADARKLQTIRDNPDMEIVFANGQMNARARPLEELALRAGQRQLAESIRQEENLENVIEISKKELQSAEQVSEEPIDEDWITRFFEIAKDVRSEDMQFIWGKILAGEIAKPKSFSLRTLETIRNINADEAKLFEKILPFTIGCSGNLFVPKDLLDLTDYKITYGHIIRLDEFGFINSTGATAPLSIPANCNRAVIMNTNREVLTVSNLSGSGISSSIPVFPFTQAAIELMNILDRPSNQSFFVQYVKRIHERSPFSNTTMGVFQIDHIEGKNAFFDADKPIYTFCPVTTRYSGLARQ